MKKYFYFGKAPNSAMVPLFECCAEEDPTAAQMNTIYEQLVKQNGLGAPRPTHYAVLDLHEVEQTEETENLPILLHRNGETVH